MMLYARLLGVASLVNGRRWRTLAGQPRAEDAERTDIQRQGSERQVKSPELLEAKDDEKTKSRTRRSTGGQEMLWFQKIRKRQSRGAKRNKVT